MVISKRLLSICSYIRQNSSVFDVGADHGIIEKYLLDNKLVSKITAVENKRGPYENLKKNLTNYNCNVIFSDGISSITPEFNTIIIAGMGGEQIINILFENKEKLAKIDQIIVDAHKNIDEVRKKIVSLGFYIEKEKIIYEKSKYYFVINFKKGKCKYNDVIYKFGYETFKDENFLNYKNWYIRNLKQIKANIIANQNNEKQLKEIDEKIKEIENYGNNKII